MQRLKELFGRRRTCEPKDLNDAVLECIYDLSLGDQSGRTIGSSAQIAARMEIPEDVVIGVLEELAGDKYIDIAVLRASSVTMDAMVRGIRPDGLRRLGLWPE